MDAAGVSGDVEIGAVKEGDELGDVGFSNETGWS